MKQALHRARMGIILVCLCIQFLSAQKPEQPDFTSWIGQWERQGGSSLAIEVWNMEHDSLLTGYASEMRNGSMERTENLRIIRHTYTTHYEATVFGQNDSQPVLFTLVRYSDRQWLFRNPDHDFPQTIEYKVNKKHMQVILTGPSPDGLTKKFILHFKKKKLKHKNK